VSVEPSRSARAIPSSSAIEVVSTSVGIGSVYCSPAGRSGLRPRSRGSLRLQQIGSTSGCFRRSRGSYSNRDTTRCPVLAFRRFPVISFGAGVRSRLVMPGTPLTVAFSEPCWFCIVRRAKTERRSVHK
jgi:hypothetical protein